MAEGYVASAQKVGPGKNLWQRLRRVPVFPILVLFVVLVFPAALAEIIAPYGPLEGSLSNRLQPPAFLGGPKGHLFGTDRVGRDVFSRVIYGSRISITIAGVGIFFGGAIGVTLGLLAGYAGRWVDSLISGFVNLTLSLPAILIALVLAVVYGPRFESLIAVIAVSLWADYARQVRGQVLTLRELDFVARAKVAGASHFRIVVRHLLPNIMNTLIVVATLQVGYVIVFEAAMSFMGVGVPRPNPAWGLMVAEGREVVFSAWWISFFPGMAIMFVVFSLNLLGDWLRDRLDPKRRHL